jgi:hypothetical protein
MVPVKLVDGWFFGEFGLLEAQFDSVFFSGLHLEIEQSVNGLQAGEVFLLGLPHDFCKILGTVGQAQRF